MSIFNKRPEYYTSAKFRFESKRRAARVFNKTVVQIGDIFGRDFMVPFKEAYEPAPPFRRFRRMRRNGKGKSHYRPIKLEGPPTGKLP
jgi:hypothetical protein